MDKLELNTIIKSLDESSSREDAYFEFVLDDYSFIKANKDGILKFTIQLLNSIDQFDDRQDIENRVINIDGEDWLIGEDFYSYIQPVYVSRNELNEIQPIKEGWKTKFFTYGCAGVLILLGISIVIGLINIISWIVDKF